jgi:hypothetical protein
VGLVEDGFAMASASEMRLKLRFHHDRYFADFAVLHSVKFTREPCEGYGRLPERYCKGAVVQSPKTVIVEGDLVL